MEERREGARSRNPAFHRHRPAAEVSWESHVFRYYGAVQDLGTYEGQTVYRASVAATWRDYAICVLPRTRRSRRSGTCGRLAALGTKMRNISPVLLIPLCI